MHRATILVVEDDKSHAHHLRAMLERHDYRVCAPVASGEEALEILITQPVDLVLMNIQLAGTLDGVKTAAAIYHDHQVPVVLLGGDFTPERLLELADEAEPYGFLIQPVIEENLLSTITIALFRHGRDRALRQSQLELLVDSRASPQSP